MPQPTVTVHFSKPSLEAIVVPPPQQTIDHPWRQPSYQTASPAALDSFGATRRAPLGHVVMGRAGDKGSNCNVGFFVRHADEWDWLRSLLSTPTFVRLLGKEYTGNRIDRCELPGVKAVHFLLKDHLDRGSVSSSSMDPFGKNLCEYIRARWVDVPQRFLERGRV